MAWVAGVLQLRQEALDHDGLPVQALDPESDPLEVTLPETVLTRLNGPDLTTAGQELLAYVRGESDKAMPIVTSVAVRLSLTEMAAVVAQVREYRERSDYAVTWALEPDAKPVVHDWLRPESRPLVVNLTGLQAQLKVPSVRLVPGYRGYALTLVDKAVANLHRTQWGQRGPVIDSVAEWLDWLDRTRLVSRRSRTVWRQAVIDRVGEALRGLDAQSRRSLDSYESRYQIQRRDQGPQHIKFVTFFMTEQVYPKLLQRHRALPP